MPSKIVSATVRPTRPALWVAGLLVGLLGVGAAAQVGSKRGPLPDNFKAFQHKSMPYRLWIPKDYDPQQKYPIVLCLHGAGGRGTDNRGGGNEAATVLTGDEVQAEHPAFILTPQCPSGQQWVDTPWGKGSYSVERVPISDELTLALVILKKVMDEYPIDADRVYITGQSMGGYGVWDALIRYPEVFAAAVPICGGGDPSQAERLRDIPIWNFHGTDDRTVPIQASRDMQAALAKLDADAKFTELPKTGHISWSKAWRTEGLVDWLYAQQRNRETDDTRNDR